MIEQITRLGKNAIIYGVGSILNRFIGFLLLPLFTKYLTPVDYGVSSILGWMTFLIIPIFSFGIGAAMAPSYFEKDDSYRKNTTVWSAFTILLVSATILILLGVPFAKLWSNLAFQTPDFHEMVTLTLISTGISIISTPFILYLQFEERARLYAVFSVITTLVSIGSNLLLVVVFNRGIRGIIEGNLITQVVNLALFLVPTISNLKYKFRFDIVRELLRVGIPLIPSFAFLFILGQGNRYILQVFRGLEAVGIYTIGYNFGMVVSVAVDALIVAWVPYFMGFIDRQKEAKTLFGRIVTFYIVGFGTLSLMFYVFAKPIVMLMTQPAFHGAYQVVGFAATAYFLTGLYSLLLPGVYFAKEIKYVSLIQGIAAILGIGANFVLISQFGVFGAGLGLMLGYLCMVIVIVMWNKKRKQAYLQVEYEWKRIFKWCLIYSFYIVAMLWPRDYSLIEEFVVSIIALIPIPIVIYLIMNSWERKIFMELLRKILTRGIGQMQDKF